jgi:hypothetical protein
LRAGPNTWRATGAIWVFHAADDSGTNLLMGLARVNDRLPATRFEALSRFGRLRLGTNAACRLSRLAVHYSIALAASSVPGIPKHSDFVSPDMHVVGDAKYFAPVGGVGLPPPKFSIIAEHVWLLEKTGAPTTFLVFGNNRQVPVRWLERYGELASTVTFYFLSDAGDLERLGGPGR